jgi:hypothetical protein
MKKGGKGGAKTQTGLHDEAQKTITDYMEKGK